MAIVYYWHFVRDTSAASRDLFDPYASKSWIQHFCLESPVYPSIRMLLHNGKSAIDVSFSEWPHPRLIIRHQMIIATPIAEHYNQRALFGVFCQIWTFACIVALRMLPADAGRWTTYAITTLLISYPYPHPVQVAWCSRISNSVSTRAVSAALYNMAVQLQYIIAANIYREDDKPLYRRGNTILAWIGGINIIIYLLTKVVCLDIQVRWKFQGLIDGSTTRNEITQREASGMLCLRKNENPTCETLRILAAADWIFSLFHKIQSSREWTLYYFYANRTAGLQHYTAKS